jgi:hypothetical protein
MPGPFVGSLRAFPINFDQDMLILQNSSGAGGALFGRPLCRSLTPERALSQTSTTATDILQLRCDPGIFRNQRVFVCSSRCVAFNGRRLVLLRRGRRIVTGKSLACTFDRATVWSSGQSTVRVSAKRQNGDNLFHRISSAGDITHGY